MRKQSDKQYAEALYQAVKGLSGAKLHEILKQFAALLNRHQKLKQADKIIAEFIKHSKKQEGIAEIEITSARPISASLLKAIKSEFGDKVEAKELIDASLLGGIRIKTEDKILDGSLRTQLAKLKQAII